MNKVQVLNGSFDFITFEETLDWVQEWILSGKRGYLCTVNVAYLMMMRSNPRLQQFVDRAALTVADGQPIVWASRWLGCALPERITGVDLSNALMSRAQEKGFRVYLLGANPNIIKTMVIKLREKYPKLNICGFEHGYFSTTEIYERVRAIRQSGTQILLVGMGVPRQEFFLEEQWNNLGVNLAIGVGGTFEVIAGYKNRAPSLIQPIGLEWLWRLLQEPKRLWKRYLITNSQFIYFLLREILCCRVSRKSEHL